MKVIKLNFAGFTLDAIVGHPDHELLFVASQVNKAAGIADKNIANYIRRGFVSGIRLRDLVGRFPTNGELRESRDLVDKLSTNGELREPRDLVDKLSTNGELREPSGRLMRDTTWLIDEPNTYKVLLRGHSPKSEPFRKWVTEEVLPTIRKTGKYDIEQSTTDTGKQLAAEFSALRGELQVLTAEVKSLREIIKELSVNRAPVEVVESPYIGTTKVAVCDRIESRTLRDVADSMGLPTAVAVKITGRVALSIEQVMSSEWQKTDGRKLDTSTSQKGRYWNLYPKTWLDIKLTREMYRSAITMVLENTF